MASFTITVTTTTRTRRRNDAEELDMGIVTVRAATTTGPNKCRNERTLTEVHSRAHPL